ncbi:hypothetical protein Sango_0371200 [Sesamum angolense]|uniref:RING-CH-type domain-containing protein n=1 Tax=Sesamum angolense TaxID=2727404 RepID=A0AAE1X9Q5_9LAMI|nr:hypothetical protein Sango_0371200 [Sesamum angolense]
MAANYSGQDNIGFPQAPPDSKEPYPQQPASRFPNGQDTSTIKAEYVMKKSLKAVGAWKLHVLALELSRDCIQRWCSEKGNTTCEICLQKFRPGYTSSPKITHSVHTTVTIRGNWDVPRIEPEPENTGESPEPDYSHCAAAADRTVSCCRLVALIFTALLLIRHLFAVLTVGTGGYPFSLLTMLIVKAGGILVPMYTLIRILAVIHNRIKHQGYQNPNAELLTSDDEGGEQHSNAEIQQP